MKATLEFITERFERFNREIFGGRLPAVPVSLCDATSFVGQYRSRTHTSPDGHSEPHDHILRFSTAFDLPERELEDTIIHEMIHYFVAYNGLHDRSAHGPLFNALMNSINENHGRAISISRRLTPEEKSNLASAKKKWHVIAIIHFTSGEKGVKVLPRVVPKIIEYHRYLTGAGNVSAVDLYLHNDAYFNRFPTSTGRRCHMITPSDIATHLRGAHRLTVSGNRLLQH